MKTAAKRFRWALVTGVAAIALGLFAHPASASQVPSNEELYRMILELQANQQRLQREAEKAKAEAAAAQAELEKTRRELDAARGALEQTQKVVTATRKDLAQTRSVLGTAPSGSVVKVPNNPGGLFALGEFIYLRPAIDQLGYVIVNPTGGSEPGPGSTLQSIDTEYEPGFRVGVGASFAGTGIDAEVKYSHLDADASDSVSEPSGGNLLMTLTPPDEEERADDATADYELDYRVVDLEVGQNLQVGSDVNFRVFGGVRYANLDQALEADFLGDSFSSVDPGQVNISMDFWGVGPRIGAEGAWTVGGSGFSVFGGLATSLLVGEFDGNYRFFEDFDPITPDFEIDTDLESQFVPVLEANLGLGWQGQLTDRIRLSARLGYQFEQWFNTVGMLQLIDDDGEAAVNTDRTDLGLHGPFLEAKGTF